MPSPGSEAAELVRALGYLLDPPVPAHQHVWTAIGVDEPPTAADHTDLFVMQLVPYTSVYIGSEGMIGGAAREPIAGFWRAVGRTPPAEPDHVGHLLGLLAELLEPPSDDRADTALARHAADVLVDEHLGTWLGPWLCRVGELGHPAYRRWASLLTETVLSDAKPVPVTNSAAGAQSLVEHLLAAGRSGVIVTRADLERCAADTGLGARIGERAYTLEALLDQDRTRVLRWFADMVGSWIELAPLPADWVERADATRRMLETAESRTRHSSS